MHPLVRSSVYRDMHPLQVCIKTHIPPCVDTHTQTLTTFRAHTRACGVLNRWCGCERGPIALSYATAVKPFTDTATPITNSDGLFSLYPSTLYPFISLVCVCPCVCARAWVLRVNVSNMRRGGIVCEFVRHEACHPPADMHLDMRRATHLHAQRVRRCGRSIKYERHRT